MVPYLPLSRQSLSSGLRLGNFASSNTLDSTLGFLGNSFGSFASSSLACWLGGTLGGLSGRLSCLGFSLSLLGSSLSSRLGCGLSSTLGGNLRSSSWGL